MKNRITFALSVMVIGYTASACGPWPSFTSTATPTNTPIFISIPISTAAPTENDATSTTLIDWLNFDGHFYKLTEPMTWPDAEAQAVTWGGHLITINDRAEELWLRNQFELQEYWIGLNDIGGEGTWVWAGGGSIAYTNWCAGEPNNAGGSENAAALNWKSGGDCWNDVPLEGLNRGIAERLP